MVAPIDFFNSPLLNKITEYLNLLTWEKWVIISLVALVVLNICVAGLSELFFKKIKLNRYKKILKRIENWTLYFALIFLFSLVFSPPIFVVLNMLGWIRGSLLLLAISLFFFSSVVAMFHVITPIKSKIENRKVIIWLLLALIGLIVICFIAGEADYKYRKGKEQQSEFIGRDRKE